MLRVFTSFSGYDSQCLALDRIGVPYVLVGYSEIDPHAIKAHNAIYPQYAERNYGDISKIDWDKVPDFDLFTYSSPCFVAGTLVNTKRGMIPIEEVKVGDMVLTHKNRYQKVLRTGSKVSNDLYRIKGISFDEIVCTGNHPFYVRKTLDNQAEWVQASRITTDNYVCVLRKNKYDMFWWVCPKSIEPIEGETATVYNLEVENDNSYTANDVIVHNCQDFSSAGKQRGGEKGSGNIIDPKRGQKEMGVLEILNPDKDGNARTIGTHYADMNAESVTRKSGDGYVRTAVREPSFRIRKLTNRECFRLMGVDDADIDKIQAAGISKSQQYKLAGNSIVVDVLAAIFRKMFIDSSNEEAQLTLF